jgi:hypothetical protein
MQQEAMEDDKNNPKYAKLLAEYSKVSLMRLYIENFAKFPYQNFPLGFSKQKKIAATGTGESIKECCC